MWTFSFDSGHNFLKKFLNLIKRSYVRKLILIDVKPWQWSSHAEFFCSVSGLIGKSAQSATRQHCGWFLSNMIYFVDWDQWSYIGWQNLIPLSHPNAILAPQARPVVTFLTMWTSESDILCIIIGRCWWLHLTLLFIDQPEPDCDSNLSLTSVKNISMKGQIDLKIFEGKNPNNFNFQWPVCHLSFQKLLEPTNLTSLNLKLWTREC